jgi:hypothetical protein
MSTAIMCKHLWRRGERNRVVARRAASPEMSLIERESELRMSLRHVQTGRWCIVRQQNVIITLRDKGLPTEQAEAVLHWLEETQRGFEAHYKQVLSEGFAEIEWGYEALGVLSPGRRPAPFESLVESAPEEASDVK